MMISSFRAVLPPRREKASRNGTSARMAEGRACLIHRTVLLHATRDQQCFRGNGGCETGDHAYFEGEKHGGQPGLLQHQAGV